MDGSHVRGPKPIEISPEFLRHQTNAGVTVAEIAEMVGRGRKCIYRHMREYGIKPFTSRRIDHKLVKKLWLEFIAAEDIAEQAICSRNAVRRIVRDLGLPKRDPDLVRPARRDVVKAPKMAPAPASAPHLGSEIAASSARVDAKIMRSKGRYGELAEIEAKHGLRRGQALARWHVLRAG